MDLTLFFKAALIGLGIAAPVGPIGLLCIQRTLTYGAPVGYLSGLGAAVADLIYGAIGAFGLSALMQAFVSLTTPLTLAGALFLAWMGLQILRGTAATATHAPSRALGSARAFVSVLLLTLANPMTLLSFIAVFAAINGATVTDSQSAMTMVLGVFIGSALWWLLLVALVSGLRRRISTAWTQWINRIAGLFLIAFAAWQLVVVLQRVTL